MRYAVKKLFLLFIVILFSFSLFAFQSSSKTKIIKEETKVLSETSTAIWLIGQNENRENFIPFFIVLKGSKNWHNTKVENKDNLSSNPVTLNWKVGNNIKIKINYDIEKNIIELFGQSYNRKDCNIFLIDEIDKNPKIVGTDFIQVQDKDLEDVTGQFISSSEKVSSFIK